MYLIIVCFLITFNVINGRETSYRNIRIVNGSDANIEDYPYQVLLFYDEFPKCGGALLTPQHIVTAAHCLLSRRNKTKWAVIAGTSLENYGGEIRTPIKLSSYPLYDRKTKEYDIALMKMDKPFTIGKSAQTVRLPVQASEIPPGIGANLTGWGRTQEVGKRSNMLQVVVVLIVSQEECNVSYDNRITDKMVCAGYKNGGKDACLGDSGSPLVVDGILIGITSWGIGCGRPNKYGVYTKVSYFTDAINIYLKTS